jgi:MFS family permease
MEQEQKTEKLWRKDYFIIIFATGGISTCNYFFNTTLPFYAQTISSTTAYSGLLIAAYTFAALAVRPVSGILSDRFGRTKLLILGALICSIACALYHTAAVFFLLILIRILHGIGFGIHSTAGGAVAGDIIPKPRMAEGLGYFALSSTFAAAIAPGIALSIIGTGTVPEFKRLFLLAAAVSLASMVFDCFISYERKNKKEALQSPTPEKPDGDGHEANLPKTFLGFEYAVFLPASVNILMYIALSGVTSYLSLFARERNLGNVGFFFTITATGLFMSRVFLGKVADRRGSGVLVIPSLAVLTVCLAQLPFASSLYYLYVLAFPIGMAQGAMGPSLNSMIFQRCSPQRRGTASAAFFSSIDIGLGVGSILCGFIADRLSFYYVYFGASLVTLIALAIFIPDMLKHRDPA